MGGAAEEHWLVDPGEIVLFPGRILGNGSYGVVVAGRLCGTLVAVKVPLFQCVADKMKSLASELRVLRRLRHPGIVAFLGVCIDASAGEICLLEDLVSGTTLTLAMSNMDSQGPLHVQWRRDILLGVAEALRYLHHQEPPIIHGDIKPNNVLVEHGSWRPKLIDFGLASICAGRSHARGIHGSLRWVAPEIMRNCLPHTSADVLSFGRVA